MPKSKRLTKKEKRTIYGVLYVHASRHPRMAKKLQKIADKLK